jgi:hypothetical protein
MLSPPWMLSLPYSPPPHPIFSSPAVLLDCSSPWLISPLVFSLLLGRPPPCLLLLSFLLLCCYLLLILYCIFSSLADHSSLSILYLLVPSRVTQQADPFQDIIYYDRQIEEFLLVLYITFDAGRLPSDSKAGHNRLQLDNSKTYLSIDFVDTILSTGLSSSAKSKSLLNLYFGSISRLTYKNIIKWAFLSEL